MTAPSTQARVAQLFSSEMASVPEAETRTAAMSDVASWPILLKNLLVETVKAD
jgi:hypothetical protein